MKLNTLLIAAAACAMLAACSTSNAGESSSSGYGERTFHRGQIEK